MQLPGIWTQPWVVRLNCRNSQVFSLNIRIPYTHIDTYIPHRHDWHSVFLGFWSWSETARDSWYRMMIQIVMHDETRKITILDEAPTVTVMRLLLCIGFPALLTTAFVLSKTIMINFWCSPCACFSFQTRDLECASSTKHRDAVYFVRGVRKLCHANILVTDPNHFVSPWHWDLVRDVTSVNDHHTLLLVWKMLHIAYSPN